MFKDTKVFSSFSTNDIEKAKQFYSETLGFEVLQTKEGLELHTTGGNMIFVYPKPNHTPATFTVLNFLVDNVEQAVDMLNQKGVVMEQYNIPPYIQTDAKGIAHGDGSMGPKAVAWFKDPSGNILSLMQK